MAASWECPSLPMLSLPFKETAKTSFLGLKPLIGAHYEENPNTFSEEIRQLDQLREHSTRPTKDYNGCSVLRRYFAQLHLLRARFPPETLGQIPVDFIWKDAYSGAEYIQEGFQIEQASVLYNIAALHAQLGSHGKRDTEQEMKEAITHFQCSAGALSYLDEHFAINHASKDLSPEFVSFYHNLMLGQAQECLVEKSLKGIGRVKNATISKLATRVSEFYSRCAGLLEGSVCTAIAKKNKDWLKLLKFKVLYYQSVAHFYQGAHTEELGKYGELIALTQLTVQKLNSITGKPPKGMGDLVKIARQNFADHVTDKLAVAKRQNEQVYHDTVPPIESLELLPGADLVKPISFHPTDPKNLGTDIFSRLIPMRAHEVASIYSEEKAKLMRSVISSVEEKDGELEQYMKSLNANEVEKIHDGPPAIPSNILQMHQSLHGRVDEVRKLHSSCQELMAMSRCVDEDFAAISEMKQREDAEEEKFQSEHGVRTPSQMVIGLWKELENYHKYNTQASKSNAELKAMFDQHYPNLVLLTSPLASLKASLPKMTLLDTPAEDASESERWQHLLKEVEKMMKQRQVLVSRFREQMSHDDITKNLVGHLGNDQEVFMEDHMKQFKELATIIRQNLAAQDNILIALTEANAKKASTRQTIQEIEQQQQAMFASLIKSGGFLNLLQTKIKEGIEFYRKLQGSVSRLKKRVEEVCVARNRDRNSVEKQKQPVTPPESPAPIPPPAGPQPTSGSSAPVRPPKKAELAGNPLPPEQQQLPVTPNALPSDTTPVPGTQSAPGPVNTHPTTTQVQLNMQELQMQQQGLLGGISMPTPSGPPQAGETQPTNAPESVEQPSVQQENPPTPQTLVSPSVPVPDATQALNSLQMLMQQVNIIETSQPSNVTSGHTESGDNSGNFVDSTASDSSQIPQRPPKPSHLKAGLLPSPFPSLPATDTQNGNHSVLPQSGLGEPQFSQTRNEPVPADAPANLYSGIASSPVSPPGESKATEQPQPHITPVGLSQQLQSPSSECPPSLWIAQTSAKGSESKEPVLSPHATQPPLQPATPTETPTALNHTPGQDVSMSQTQPPMSPDSVQNPYHQSNINIQPGEITVATSSILGPIPSALAVTSSTQSTLIPSFTTSSPTIASTLPTQPTLQPSSVAPQSLESSLQSLGNGLIASSSTSLSGKPTRTDTATTTTVPTQPQYTVSQSKDNTLTTVTTEGDNLHSSVETKSERETAASQTTGHLQDVTSEHMPETSGQDMELPAQPSVSFAGDTVMLGYSSSNSVFGLNPAPVPSSETNPTTTLTGVNLPELMGNKMVGELPSVHPLPLSLSSLSTPLSLEAQTNGTPLTTELLIEETASQHQQAMSVMQIQVLQQSIEDHKKVIEMHRAEKETFKVQEEAYQQQIAQLQQQLMMLQQKQDQEKASASDQQNALMKLLHQQQGMFSQQQSQIEKLSQQDESHRKEYLHIEEKFRETLRAEQEMKSSLQNQIMQLTQENQKLNQAVQAQTQQMQALQMQLQQYSVHIQERDKQLVAFKDQHKQIVDKLEQRTQQKVAQLIQKIQELRLELNRRQDGPPSLPQPLQPTVVVPQRPVNQQQSQDLGPSVLQPNLPQPMRPNVPQVPPTGRAPSSSTQQPSGGIQMPSSVYPGSTQRPMMTPPPPQGMPATVPIVPNPLPIKQPQSQPVQAQNVPLPVDVRPQGHPQMPASSQPPSPVVPPQLQPHPQPAVSPRPISYPLQSRSSFLSNQPALSHQPPDSQQQQQPGSAVLYQSPADPSLQQVHRPQQVVPPTARPAHNPHIPPMQAQITGQQRFPLQGEPMMRILQPGSMPMQPLTHGQPSYGNIQQPQYHGHVP